jgi:pyrrolidone-carboxylate peptidase
MNLKDYRIADNDGHQPQDCPIDKKAPDLLRTLLDLPTIKAGLTRAGFSCDISNHAGTYICNELYFRAQQYQEDQKSIKAVLFVHWPEPQDFIKGAAASKKKNLARQATLAMRNKGAQLKIMEQALVEIVERAALVL